MVLVSNYYPATHLHNTNATPLEAMAAIDSANQESTMAQQQILNLNCNATGASKFVGQILLNRLQATQHSFYAILEENDFENDILSLWTVDNLETF